MENENKRKRGRPPKLSFEEKKQIVDSFFAFEAGYDHRKLKEYNIYTQLANYAAKLNWLGNGRPITPKNLADPDIRTYINALAGIEGSSSKSHAVCVPVYTPLDIQMLYTKSIDEIIRLIKEREVYYESVCINAGKTAKQCMALQEEINITKNNLHDMLKELQSARKTILDLTQRLDDVNSYLKQVKRVAKKAEEQRIQTYFETIPDRGHGEKVWSLMGQHPISAFSSDSNDDDLSFAEEWDYDR